MQQWVPHVGALLAVLAPEGLGKHSTGLEKSMSAWAWGTQLLWHSQVGHGFKIPRKALGGSQAPTPKRGTTPAKPRPRGTWMPQLVLQMRKKRWWPLREGVGDCLSCRPGCSAHLRPGLVLQDSCLLLAMLLLREALSGRGKGLIPPQNPFLWGCDHFLVKFLQSRAAQPTLLRFSASPSHRSAVPMLRSPMGPNFPHPGVPCPAGAPL